MKKILIGSMMILAISSTGFARMHNPEEKPAPVPPHMLKMREENRKIDPEFERERILIEEKKLEIRKELLNEKPDWNKIEKLNVEVATQEAKHRTARMKEKFEASFNTQNTATPVTTATTNTTTNN